MTKNMTSGTPAILLLLFAVPLIIGNIFQQFYNMVDSMIVGKYVGADVKVKAAGGISSFDDAEKFMKLGADRLGTSRLIPLLCGNDSGKGY